MATIVFNPHNITFIHIPKTGGNSITSWLQKNSQCKITKRKQHASLQQILDGDHSLGPLEKNSLGELFCVVRNPWDYCVSWYKFKIRLCESYINQIYKCPQKIDNKKIKWNLDRQQVNLKRLKDLGFKGWLLQTGRKPQYKWAKDCDIILKFENLEIDFKLIQNKLKCYTPLPHLNKTPNRCNYSEYYDQESIDLVAAKFKIDIETYNYDFNTT